MTWWDSQVTSPWTRVCGTRTSGYRIRTTIDATLNGSFVGDSIEGPLGVLGTWTVTGHLDGAYGADIEGP